MVLDLNPSILSTAQGILIRSVKMPLAFLFDIKKKQKMSQRRNHMEEHTLSITIGSGDIRHNNRLFRPSNVDHSRTPDNITLVKEDIQDAYHRLFDESVNKYNESQKRNDRKIKNYFDKIYRSKKEKPFYEFIVQVGNQTEQPDQKKCKEVLEDFHKMMQKDYPNMAIFNSVIHVDESTPHLHLDFIPIGEGYKKGLEKRVSMQKAMQNLGFSNYADFRNELMQKFEEIAKKHDIERKRDVAVGERHLTIQDYRALQRMAEQKINDLDKTRVPRSSSRVLKKLKLVPNNMYEEIVKDNAYRKAQNSAISSENNALRSQISKLKTKNNIDTYEAVIENQKNKIEDLNFDLEEIKYNFNVMQKSFDNMQKKSDDENDVLQKKVEELEKGSAALKVQISDKEKTIENLKSQSKDLEKMGQILSENEKLKNDVKKLSKTEQENRNLKTQISGLKSENETLHKEYKELNVQKTAQISNLSDENKKLNRIVKVFIKTLQKLSECEIGDFPKFKSRATAHIPTTAEGLSEEDLCEMEKEWDEERHIYAQRVTRGR